MTIEDPTTGERSRAEQLLIDIAEAIERHNGALPRPAYWQGRIEQFVADEDAHRETLPTIVGERLWEPEDETAYLRRIFEVARRHADRVYEADDKNPDGPTSVADTDPEPADAELEEPSEDAPDPESAPAEDQGASEPEVEPEAEIRGRCGENAGGRPRGCRHRSER